MSNSGPHGPLVGVVLEGKTHLIAEFHKTVLYFEDYSRMEKQQFSSAVFKETSRFCHSPVIDDTNADDADG